MHTDQYPILKNYTYLNTANHGLLSQDLVDYRAKLTRQMRDEASLMTNQRNVFIDGVRHSIATFLHADPEFTAVIPNFSTGFNILINDIDPAARFLLLENDYPSVNWPIETRGFTNFKVQIDEHMEEQLLQVCKEKEPDYFCFSMVQYISGIKMNLDFLNDLKKQFPKMILIADFTQYVGLEEYRFRESGIDIILASCYKWLHAGDGNGFVCAKKEVQHAIFPRTIGFRSARNIMDPNVSFISRFEPGHQDMIAFGTLQEAILKAQELGWEYITEKTMKIAKIAKIAFQERGLLTEVVVRREEHSSIFNIKGDKELYQKLLDHQIITSLRGDGIRVSFTYLNTEEDLNKLLEVVDL